MIRAFYSGASGMMAQQKGIDIQSNNIANIQTTGFKKSRPEFSDLIYSTLRQSDNEKAGVQMGNGVKVHAAHRSFMQGNLYSTDNSLDMAIDGSGFFVIDNGSGEQFYTRDGSFKLSTQTQGDFIVTSRGEYLLDIEGNRIQLPDGVETLNISESGLIHSLNNIQIALVRFPNAEGLEAVGGNLYRETPASGLPLDQNTGIIKQGFLESSNVNLLEEITALIRGQRVFQLNSRIVQTADEMEGTANNLRT